MYHYPWARYRMRQARREQQFRLLERWVERVQESLRHARDQALERDDRLSAQLPYSARGEWGRRSLLERTRPRAAEKRRAKPKEAGADEESGAPVRAEAAKKSAETEDRRPPSRKRAEPPN